MFRDNYFIFCFSIFCKCFFLKCIVISSILNPQFNVSKRGEGGRGGSHPAKYSGQIGDSEICPVLSGISEGFDQSGLYPVMSVFMLSGGLNESGLYPVIIMGFRKTCR